MLHIGSKRVVARADIIAILPAEGEQGVKSRVIMSDGRVMTSPIAAATLKKRLRDNLYPGRP
ncbi:DUF370 domain-containing protein [Eubacteriales bacterium OttesenSCG-928-A19]|nr:DUF370 domain-containing protein [Eubacteriales bacterium OttesenSCG-928-A19]